MAPVRSAIGHVRDPLYLNAYALMASNLMTSALGVVYWALAARFYAVETVGVASATISLIAFLSGLSQLNLRAALLRLVPEAGAAAPRLVATGGALGLIAFEAMSAFRLEPVASLDVGGLSVLSVVLLTAATIVWNVFNIQDGLLTGLRRTIWVPLENAAYGIAKLVVLIGIAGTGTAAAILTSWYVPVVAVVAVVTAVVAWRWLPEHARAVLDRQHAATTLIGQRRRLLRYVASDYIASLFALATSTLLPVLIANSLGAAHQDEVAYFYLAWIVAASLDLLPINPFASLTVEAASGRADLATETRRALLHSARILVPVMLGIAVFAPLLLQVFGATYAARGTDLLRLLALGVIPYMVVTICLAAARVQGRSRDLVAIQAALAVLALGGSALLVGPYGITGVGVAMLGARTIMAIILGWTRLWPLLRGRAAR